MSESSEDRNYEVEFSNLYAIGPSREVAKAKFEEMVQQAAKDGWKLPEGLATATASATQAGSVVLWNLQGGKLAAHRLALLVEARPRARERRDAVALGCKPQRKGGDTFGPLRAHDWPVRAPRGARRVP